MRHVRRHWYAAIPIVLASLAVLVWLYRPTPAGGTESAGGTSATLLDAASYSRLRALRETLCLTSADLAAMDLSPSSAAQLLTNLVGWYQQNHQMIEAAEQQLVLVERAQSALERRASTGEGPAVESAELNALREQAKQAISGRKSLQESARAAVAASLSPSAVAVWDAARANAGLPWQLRYVPNLTREETAQLLNLLERQARGEDVRSEIGQVLGARQAPAEAALGRASMNAIAIAAAEAELLPLPREFREQDADVAR